MSWKRWLIHYCPKDWSNEEILKFILTCLKGGKYIKPTIKDIQRLRPQ